MRKKQAALRPCRRWLIRAGGILLMGLVLLLTGALAAYAPSSPFMTQGRVHVYQAVEVNDSIWDGHLLDSPVPGLFSNAGVKSLRDLGGSLTDNGVIHGYHAVRYADNGVIHGN